MNAVRYLPGGRTVAIAGDKLVLYSLVKNEILFSSPYSSWSLVVNFEKNELIMAKTNRFVFYKIIRRWEVIR